MLLKFLQGTVQAPTPKAPPAQIITVHPRTRQALALSLPDSSSGSGVPNHALPTPICPQSLCSTPVSHSKVCTSYKGAPPTRLLRALDPRGCRGRTQGIEIKKKPGGTRSQACSAASAQAACGRVQHGLHGRVHVTPRHSATWEHQKVQQRCLFPAFLNVRGEATVPKTLMAATGRSTGPPGPVHPTCSHVHALLDFLRVTVLALWRSR